MPKLPFTLLLFIFSVQFLPAQTKSEEMKQIINARSDREAISLGRIYVWQKFVQSNRFELEGILAYFDTGVREKDQMAFLPEERFLYYYWLGDFEKCISYAMQLDSSSIAQTLAKAWPTAADEYLPVQVDILRSQRWDIYSVIEHHDQLSEMDKTFLKMHFDYLLTYGTGKDEAVDSLNARASDFQNKYPDSKYRYYIKKTVGVEVIPKNWILKAEYFTGFGMFTGKMQNAFGPVIPVGISFDVLYKSFGLRVIDYIGFNKTRDTIDNGKQIWKKGSPSRVFLPGIVLGYNVIDKKEYKLFPFAGVSAAAIIAPLFKSGRAEYANVGFDFTSAPSVGISFDKFLGPHYSTEYLMMERDLSYFRITYTYYLTSFEWRYPGYSGVMHSLTIGLVFHSSPTRRIK